MSDRSHEPTNGEILQNLKSLQTSFEDMFEVVTFIKDNAAMREETASKEDLAVLTSRVNRIESTMVTKEYLVKELSKLPTKYDLDDKLGDLKGDLVVLMRKEDRKLAALIQRLKERKVLSEEDVQDILALEPFPQMGMS